MSAPPPITTSPTERQAQGFQRYVTPRTSDLWTPERLERAEADARYRGLVDWLERFLGEGED